MLQVQNILLLVFLVWANALNALPPVCFEHEVQTGETLYRISVKYKVKVSEILAVNPELGKDPTLRIGQKVCIPRVQAAVPQSSVSPQKVTAPTKAPAMAVNPIKQGDQWIHIVQREESFYTICKKYKILAYDLISTNNLPNTIIAENQRLILPATAIVGEENSKPASKEVSPLVTMTNTAAEDAKREVVVEKKKDSAPAIISDKNAAVHIVKQGDTYYNITKRYGMKSSELKALNNLASTDITLGQKLTVINRTEAPINTEVHEDKIPANAVVIDIAKEVAKSEVKTNEVKEETPAPPIVKSTKSNKEKHTQKVDEEQARLDMAAAIKPEATPPNTAAQKEPELATVSTAAKETAEEEKKEVPQAVVVEKEVSAAPIVTDAVVVDVTTEIEKPILSAKPVLSFADEYAVSFQHKLGSQNYKVKKQRGVAALSDAIIGNEYLAYSSSCEPGTVIKITNLMSKRSTYVKVIGGSSSDAILTISAKLASKLDVLDGEFLAEVSTLTKNQ